MQMQFKILSVMAGKIEDNGMLFSNAFVLEEDPNFINTPDRVDIGLKVAKIKMSTDNNNALARRLVTSEFPLDVLCTVKTAVQKGGMTLTITDFEAL